MVVGTTYRLPAIDLRLSGAIVSRLFGISLWRRDGSPKDMRLLALAIGPKDMRGALPGAVLCRRPAILGWPSFSAI